MRTWAVARALNGLMLVPTLLLAGASLAADAPQPTPQGSAADQELDEVLVEGRRAREQRPGWKELQKPIDWLARLVGRFVVDGYVDLQGNGNAEDILPVQGRADCVGFGIAPGVECDLKIRWPERKGPGGEQIPGGFPNLNPAVILYGYERTESGIHYILVDSKGAAESAVGQHISADTMQSRSRCAALSDDCSRLVRITAWPDLRMVEMRIEQKVDGQKTARFQFMLHRVPGSPSVVFGRKK